jgi:hypothetical protein
MAKKIRSRCRPGDNGVAPSEQPTVPNETSPEPTSPEVNDEIASCIETDSEPLTVEQGPEKHEKRKKAEIREARIKSKGMKSASIHADHIDVHDMNASMFMS